MFPRRTFIGALLGTVACVGRRPSPIPYFEYAESDHAIPYVLLYDMGQGALLFFGSDHISDPDHEQNAQIMNHWSRFGPTLALNEGGHPPTESSAEEAVSRYGESGLVRFLAARDEVAVDTLEPSYAKQVQVLTARGFKAKEIKLFYILRQVAQMRDPDSAIGSAKAAEVVAYFSTVEGLGAAPTTVGELDTACHLMFSELSSWVDVPLAWFDPVYDRPPTILNQVSRATSEYRDEWVVDLLAERAKGGERVFAVMGASHVVIQEPVLTARLGRPRQLPPGPGQAWRDDLTPHMYRSSG